MWVPEWKLCPITTWAICLAYLTQAQFITMVTATEINGTNVLLFYSSLYCARIYKMQTRPTAFTRLPNPFMFSVSDLFIFLHWFKNFIVISRLWGELDKHNHIFQWQLSIPKEQRYRTPRNNVEGKVKQTDETGGGIKEKDKNKEANTSTAFLSIFMTVTNIAYVINTEGMGLWIHTVHTSNELSLLLKKTPAPRCQFFRMIFYTSLWSASKFMQGIRSSSHVLLLD